MRILAVLCVLGPLLSGCVPPAVVRADLDADVAAQANLASLVANVATATSQPASAEAVQHAGRDGRQTTTTINVSGSAWPIVAVAAAIAAAVLGVVYLRAELRRHRDVETAGHAVHRAAREYGTLERNATAVAKAISCLPAGADRDRLLTAIRDELAARGDLVDWDKLLAAGGLRVRRYNRRNKKASSAAGTVT